MRSKGFSFYFGGLGVGMRRRFYDRKHPPPFPWGRHRHLLSHVLDLVKGILWRLATLHVPAVGLRKLASGDYNP